MNIKNITFCSLTNFKKWIVDIKIYVLFILIFVFSIWNLSELYEYSKVVGIGVSPWFFPHLLTVPVTVPIFSCFAMLLFSNAPFIDRHMPFILVRTGRITWVLGQLLYIFFASLLYTVTNYLITVIAFIPRIDFTSDWGKIIRTLALNPASAMEKGIEKTVNIQNGIVSTFSAIEATLISLGLFFLVTFFIGIVIFSLNLMIGKMSGLIAIGILVFISYFSIFVGRLTIGLKVFYFSPLSWTSLQYVDWYGSGEAPSFLYVVVFLLGTSLILCFLSIVSFAKKDINIAEGVE